VVHHHRGRHHRSDVVVMNIVAIEYGDRPGLFTKARRFAPEGVKLLAEVMGHMEFAEDGIIILDWSNELALQPTEAVIPVVIIRTTKFVPEVSQRLTVEVRLDVEDTFGRDDITAQNLLDIIQQMAAKMLDAIERARSN
jgi:hypothetical protein